VTGPADAQVLDALSVGPSDADLDALRRRTGVDGKRAAVMELETVFFTQLLAAMRKTVPEDTFLPASPARHVYEGVFDESVARALAAGDPLGMLQTLAGGPAKVPGDPSR
jgi:Rod binding domain-containing protein